MSAQVERAHALCSPSGADRWMECVGSVAMEVDEPDSTSAFAEEGTEAHAFAEKWLRIGAPDPHLTANDEMYENVKFYVEFVQFRMAEHETAGAKATLLVEQTLPLQDVTGERNASGTSDVVILAEYPDRAEMDVMDLKYGRGVEVDDMTAQLPIYAIAAVRKFGLMLDFAFVHTTIVQPRVNRSPVTISHTIAGLEAFGEKVMERAQMALRILNDGPATALSHLKVTDKGCRFCRAKHKCPELARHVHESVFGEMQAIEGDELVALDETNFVGSRKDFEDLLPKFMHRVPVIEAWCKYIRAKVEQLLIDGKPVRGFKLVQGRMGARKWLDEKAVMMVMASAHVPRELVMTLPELRSPADIEKKVKKTYPNAWQPLQGLIAQAPGSPSVAPVDDPRPTYSSAVFDGESYAADDLV